MVPGTGIEPVQPFGRGILSPLRLPISPSGQLLCGLYPVHRTKKGKHVFVLSLHVLERETSLELATSTLARLRSTN